MEFILGFALGGLLFFIVYKKRIRSLEDEVRLLKLRLRGARQTTENWRKEYYKK